MHKYFSAHILKQIKMILFLMTKVKDTDNWLYNNIKYLKATDARKKNLPTFQTHVFPFTW